MDYWRGAVASPIKKKDELLLSCQPNQRNGGLICSPKSSLVDEPYTCSLDQTPPKRDASNDHDQDVEDMVNRAMSRSPSLRKMRSHHEQTHKSVASTERMTRNTDSMLEDVVIADKLKRRLWTRRQAHRKSIANSDLSDFITKSLTEERSLDAVAAAIPTDACLSLAADAALAACMEGYFMDYADANTRSQAKSIFMDSLKREEFHLEDIVCRQNEAGDKLYIVEEGTVEFVIGELVAGTANAGSLFGELSLVYGVPRTSTVRVISPLAIMWSIQALGFRRIQALVANESLRAAATNPEDSSSPTPPISPTGSSESRASRLQLLKKQHSSLSDLQERSDRNITSPIKMKQLKREAIVGRGTFGSVYMVSRQTHQETSGEDLDELSEQPDYYGLKCMSKQSIVRRGNEKRVLIERNALKETVDSPFVVRLLSTYQDANCIYFLTEFVQAGTLMTYMIEKDVLSHDECTFFAANIISALVHIHKKGFVHRDIKPENCLIDKNGYIKICDFGMAKRLPATVNLPSGGTEVVTLAFTMCGTPEFMAPEFVLSTGYDKGVDVWALGCILVEMYSGRSPFEFDGNLKTTFKEVCTIGMGRKALETPEEMLLPGLEAAEDFAHAILTPASERLGRNDTSDVKRHEYFDSIDFDHLHAKTLIAPYIPTISNGADTSYFEHDMDDDSDNETDPENEEYSGDEDWCQDF